ncbi:MAG TPA: GDSL-type esterase/lipase family protein [Spirochaetota bacterium]|nr:GDSL-type esterase/lipase family protein [Spirochaetota bacterium]
MQKSHPSNRPDLTIQSLRAGEPITIVAIGDSLTNGWMVRKGYLDFLGEMLRETYPKAQFKIINRGIPGDTADGGLDRLRGDVIDFDPDCVLVQFALNDMFMGYPAAQYKNYLQAIIDSLINDTSAETVLVTSVCLGDTRENERANELYEKMEELARENGVSIARVHAHWARAIADGAAFRTLVQSDMVHPTVEGYRLMAEAIMQVFR